MIRNETTLWSREEFLKIKPRKQFPYFEKCSMEGIANTLEGAGGPAVIFRNDKDGPWGAIGLMDLGYPALGRRTAEAWAVTSRAMYRNLYYFNSESRSCLIYYTERYKYERITAHVRASWAASRIWLSELGFEETGEAWRVADDTIISCVWKGL